MSADDRGGDLPRDRIQYVMQPGESIWSGREVAWMRPVRFCRSCGGSHPAAPTRWKRLLHWAGWWP